MTLPPHLRGPLDRFLGSLQAQRPAVEAEPDVVAEAPADGLIRLALQLEPYARDVVHYRDRQEGDPYCGRPTLWGLAVGGEEGVRRVLDLLRAELELALALCGCSSPAELTPSHVRRAPATSVYSG